jgi:hypothetical protein
MYATDHDPVRYSSLAVAYSADPHSGVPSESGYWDFFVTSALGRRAVIVWNGNQHQAGFLVAPDPPFRVFHPRVGSGLYKESDSGVWVPRSTFREYWDWTYKDLIELINRLEGSTEVLVLGTPPPKSDSSIRLALDSEPQFREAAVSLGCAPEELPLTEAHTRLALWHTIQDDMREIAERTGARFVPVPLDITDECGFLLPQYSAPDATHANEFYGQRIADLLIGL